MLTAELRTTLVPAILVALLATGGSAGAQEGKRDPFAAFNFGWDLYRKGDKIEAAQAYRDASDMGKTAATWKLAQMYAQGDGIARDDYAAYTYFSEIVRRGAEPGSEDETFIGAAYAALGGYVSTGIPGSPVQPDIALAQQYYARAASYGNRDAQFELGRGYLEQSKKQPGRMKLAARWLNSAARNGHEGARALLGDLLFRSGKAVQGLAMMTIALKRASAHDKPWIRQMQEQAFALTDEDTRRQAIEEAERRLGRQ